MLQELDKVASLFFIMCHSADRHPKTFAGVRTGKSPAGLHRGHLGCCCVSLFEPWHLSAVPDVICCQGSRLSMSGGVLWDDSAFKKKKKVWHMYVNFSRYILKINTGSVFLSLPGQRRSSIFGPVRPVNGLINSQSRALGSRCWNCVGVC